jgi:hypothetical protein
MYCEFKNLLSSCKIGFSLHMYNVYDNNKVDRMEYSPVKKGVGA